MMRKVVNLTATLMLVMFSCLAAPAAYAQDPAQPYLKKTVERDTSVPNLYNAQIETFIEGIRKSVTTYGPIDVMLILEFSQKTSQNCGGSNLAESIDAFITSLKAMPDVNLSIVSFQGTSASLNKELGNVNDYDFSTLKSTISNGTGNIYGSSYCLPDRGLKKADENFAATPDRKQYYVLVQFGKIFYNGGEYAEAEKAWQKAYDIKQKGIKIYTVFVGSSNYEEKINDGTSYNMTTHHALEGISSDYYDAYWNLCPSSTITKNIPSYWKGYSKDGPYLKKDDHEYHFKVDKGTTMFAGVLSDIQDDAKKTEYIIVPSISLASPSVVDKLATGFKLPNGVRTSDVDCKVAPCTGKTDAGFSWGPETDAGGVTAIAADGTVTVSGFDFSGNCVYSDGNSTNVGKKLIVHYPFVINTSENSGGVNIPTTDESSSGLFDNGEKKYGFDISAAKANLVTITVTVTGLRKGDNAVVNVTKSGSDKPLRYVVEGNEGGTGTIVAKFQEPGSYTASVVGLSRIYNEMSPQTQTVSGNHSFTFNCTPNKSFNVSHAESHVQY